MPANRYHGYSHRPVRPGRTGASVSETASSLQLPVLIDEQQLASDTVVEAMRQRFMAALRDREGQPPTGQLAVRMLEKTPKNALRLRFLAKVFPDARFIYLHRDVRQTMGSMIGGWESGNFRMYPNLPGWAGPIWSFLLTPEWQHLSGMPLGAIVAGQWRTTTEILLDDLSRLEPDRWLGVDHEAFVSDPQARIERICAWAGLDWDRNLAGASLPLSRYTPARPDSDKWRRHAEAAERYLPAMQETIDRAFAASRH